MFSVAFSRVVWLEERAHSLTCVTTHNMQSLPLRRSVYFSLSVSLVLSTSVALTLPLCTFVYYTHSKSEATAISALTCSLSLPLVNTAWPRDHANMTNTDTTRSMSGERYMQGTSVTCSEYVHQEDVTVIVMMITEERAR